MTIQEIKSKGLLLFECISGSRAYGTDLPGSDTDLRGVFILPRDTYYGLGYVAQVSSDTNDETYFEIGRFAELVGKNNPNILEMLSPPDDCVQYCHPLFRPFLSTQFLSKLCRDTFAGYAVSQIKKARGLNKKINYPQPPKRKTPLDFCYVPHAQGSIPVAAWLEKQQLSAEQCGLVQVPNMRDLFGLYYDEHGTLGFSGILRKEHANEVALSAVPPGMMPLTLMSFNKDAYSMHCKEYREYQDWVEHRNPERYQNTLNHGKNYDSKNMMHTIRLLDMAAEILESGTLLVRRPDRERLLAIRRGEFEYEDLLEQAEAKISRIDALYAASSLPETPDLAAIEQLLVQLRVAWYHL